MTQRIACIGGVTLDRMVEPLERLRAGTSNPVRSETSTGGSARNIAEALSRLGCPVSLFSRLGHDAAGEQVVDELMEAAIDLDGIDRVATHSTASYTAVLDESRELVLGLADMEILDDLEPTWLDPIADALGEHRLWIVDANLPAPVLERLAGFAVEGVSIFADPVSAEKSERLAPILGRIDSLFPDRIEAAALAGVTEAETDPGELAARIRDRGPRRVVITLGAEGVWVDEPPRHERVPAMATSAVVNVTGAGDCFVAGYVFAQLATAAVDPVRCGLAAAALAVESPRAVPAELTAEALLERYRSSG